MDFLCEVKLRDYPRRGFKECSRGCQPTEQAQAVVIRPIGAGESNWFPFNSTKTVHQIRCCSISKIPDIPPEMFSCDDEIPDCECIE